MGLILDYRPGRPPRARLLDIVRTVRRRWRTRVALRGLAIVITGGTAAVVLAALAMDYFRFDTAAVIATRVISWAIVVGLFVRYLAIPLPRRISDEQVALYLEEHEPSLEASLLGAVEFGGSQESEAKPGRSAALVEKIVERALERCVAVDDGRRVERRRLARSSGWLAGATFAALIAVVLAPPFLKTGSSFLLAPLSGEPVESPYAIEVLPGDAHVARGADLRVAARLINFDADRVMILVREAGSERWETSPMNREDETGDYAFFLLDLNEPTEYRVEAGGVRSPEFTVEVSDLPYVAGLELEYRFPAYTGLEPRTQEGDGDVAALRGTEIGLHVLSTIPVLAGALIFEERDTLPLEVAADGSLSGAFTVDDETSYRIAFRTVDGAWVAGSPDYYVDVLEDLEPHVAFVKPGRDLKVTSIDEVFIEAEADDDYGVRVLELVYSLNGGEQQTIRLYSGARKHVTAGHTIYLEELTLQPGDFVSYFARARDGRRAGGAQLAMTDIYFIEVRPFDREFREAEQGGAPAAGAFSSSLAQQQRQIIAATFKLVRDRSHYTDAEYAENLVTVTLAQGKLREQVETLVGRIRSRGVVGFDSTFAVIAEALPRAAREMENAEEQLGRRDPGAALPPEQRALQQLQRAESVYRESLVARNQGGPGGGQAPNAEELADLFELELDRMRNQYESVQRAQRREVDDAVDETLQKLQELARRQQQENERLRAQAERGADGGGGGGASQRKLAEEAEEAARRLERLARERSLPELERTARELRRAAEAMRRSAAGADDEGVAQGRQALERLREARRLLDRNRSARLESEVDDVLARARRLAEQERSVMSEIESLDRGGDRIGRVERLSERKQEMAREVDDIEATLDRLGREARGEQRDAARKLQEAADALRSGKLADLMRYSRGVIRERSSEYARNFEEGIAAGTERLVEQIEEARGAMGESRDERIARSLEQTRELVGSLESLEDRVGEAGRAQEGQSDEQDGEEGGGQPRDAGEAADPNGPGGFPGFRPGDVRQFQREFRERREEAERLRDSLRSEGVATPDLDAAIERLRQLERRSTFDDPRGLTELQAETIQGLKEFEYALRRQIERGEETELLLSGSDDVPEGYRELVEEYYRSLSEDRRDR